jgi:hypothetical protein
LTDDQGQRTIMSESISMGTTTDTKQQAHNLIERLSPGQVSAVVGLLEAMLDPVSAALAGAPFDDEPVSEEEARDIAEARAAYARGEVTPQDKVLAELGLSYR